MKDFVASNGIPVALTNETAGGAMLITSEKDGTYPYTNARGDDVQALREFFQAEADERLGRWRVPGYPNWVCYPTPRAHEVVVFNEDEPQYGTQTLSRGSDTWPYYRSAADAYFDAHPEPKPWHGAVNGEHWALSRHGSAERLYKTIPWMSGQAFAPVDGGQTLAVLDRSITAGRRIWPEVS